MVIDPGNGMNTHGTSAGKARSQGQAKVENTPSATNTPSAKAATDSVSLSSESLAMAKVEANVRDSSDVDAAKVANVKAALNAGNYQIDSQAIADKIQSEERLLG